MKTYWEGNYGLVLKVEYQEDSKEWWIFDESKNYKYSYFWKQKTKPTGRTLRKRLQYCYYEARSYFEWNRL